MAKARDRILETALELFNAQGSGPVTTNHIAKACGVSTGTLYYHFKNKEEIIRALYDRMGAEWDAKVTGLGPVDMEAFREVKALSDRIFREYRFLHTELYTLCRQDPELEALNRERLQLRKFQTRVLIEGLILNQGFEPLEPEAMEFLLDAIWLFAVFWNPYREMTGNGGEEARPGEQLDLLLSRFLVKKEP